MRYGKQRVHQARFALKNAVQFGIKDADLLEQLGDLFEQEEFFPEATKAFEIAALSDNKNGLLIEKLAMAHCSEKNPKPDKESAIDHFKVAIEHIQGEGRK